MLDSVIDSTEASHTILNANFQSLLDVVEQLAGLSGVSLRKQVSTQESTTVGEDVITFPENKTKH